MLLCLGWCVLLLYGDYADSLPERTVERAGVYLNGRVCRMRLRSVMNVRRVYSRMFFCAFERLLLFYRLHVYYHMRQLLSANVTCLS